MPSYCYYFKNSNVIFNAEKGEVYQLEQFQSRTLNLLLNFKADYYSKDELIAIIDTLSKNGHIPF